jgi:SAM-dependent methyltransferase
MASEPGEMSVSTSQHNFVAQHYAPRAAAYVSSAVHSSGPDLDQIEAFVHVREVVACDLTPDMLAQVNQTAADRGLANIVTQLAAAERLPFEDGVFDFVLSRYSAHHWNNFEGGLREARRVLKAGGLALFADGISPAHPLLDTHLQAIELLRDPSHVRNYSAAEWIAALARSGFSTTAIAARKVRLEFAVWTERTRTPELYADAIRGLQTKASDPVRNHFAISDDGGFSLDTLTIEAIAL